MNMKIWDDIFFVCCISDLLTGQARQSGMRALEFDLAAKENAELKEKLEKANQEILALKNFKGKSWSKVNVEYHVFWFFVNNFGRFNLSGFFYFEDLSFF